MLEQKRLHLQILLLQYQEEIWSDGTTYDMYEHNISSSNTTTSGASNLYDSTFFFVTSDLRVYKVLDNNGGTAYSGSEPTSESQPFCIRWIYFKIYVQNNCI